MSAWGGVSQRGMSAQREAVFPEGVSAWGGLPQGGHGGVCPKGGVCTEGWVSAKRVGVCLEGGVCPGGSVCLGGLYTSPYEQNHRQV